MRALALVLLSLVHSLVYAEQGATIYGGVDGGYGIVQLRHENSYAIDTFSVAKGSVFLGYRWQSGVATEVSYLLAKEKIIGNHTGVYNVKLDVIDVALNRCVCQYDS